MPAQLVALNGAADIPLSGLLTVVGRHRGCDARIDSSRVSRRHCCLALGGGECLVRDLGSTNGTRINGRLIEDGALRPGDVLGIAHLRYRLVLIDPAGCLPRGEGPPGPGPEPDPTALALETALDMAHHNPEPPRDEPPHPGRTGRR